MLKKQQNCKLFIHNVVFGEQNGRWQKCQWKKCQLSMFQEFELKDGNFDKVMSFVYDSGKFTNGWDGPLRFIGNTIRLDQKCAGPCGLYAVLQAYILKKRRAFPQMSQEELLIHAVVDVMERCRSLYTFCQLFAEQEKRILMIGTSEKEAAIQYLKESGLLYTKIALKLLMISYAFSIGPAKLSCFVTREPFVFHGDTSLQFVYLALTGQVVDEAGDQYVISGDLIAAGCTEKQDIGVILEADGNGNVVPVGRNLGSPRENIWVVHSGGHFWAVEYSSEVVRSYDSLLGGPDEYKELGRGNWVFDRVARAGP